jgi:hypothetical protein
VGISNTQGGFRRRRRGARIAPMTNRQTHTAAPAPIRPTQIRSMQRGLRQLAVRGVSARPTAFRRSYSLATR